MVELIEKQFAPLRELVSAAELRQLPSGAFLVIVPGCELPSGWSKPRTDVKFIAPVGYPHARPDCFWIDPEVRIANGGMPMNAGLNALPEIGTPQLWFSWHLQNWNPNRDTLMTYFRVIEQRLNQAR